MNTINSHDIGNEQQNTLWQGISADCWYDVALFAGTNNGQENGDFLFVDRTGRTNTSAKVKIENEKCKRMGEKKFGKFPLGDR